MTHPYFLSMWLMFMAFLTWNVHRNKVFIWDITPWIILCIIIVIRLWIVRVGPRISFSRNVYSTTNNPLETRDQCLSSLYWSYPFHSHVLGLLVQLLSFIAVSTHRVSLVLDKTFNYNYLSESVCWEQALFIRPYTAIYSLRVSIQYD
jgi:hypothetical protein